MAKDFSHRTQSTMRYAGTNAGFMNEPVHISGIQTNYPVTPAGGYVLVTMVVNTAPGSGVILLTIGKDILAVVTASSSASFEHKYNCYLYDQLFVSTADAAADITFVITKG